MRFVSSVVATVNSYRSFSEEFPNFRGCGVPTPEAVAGVSAGLDQVDEIRRRCQTSFDVWKWHVVGHGNISGWLEAVLEITTYL